MELSKEYGNFQIHAFWSRPVTSLVDRINTHPGKSYATQHDLVLNFINKVIFQDKGEYNKEFRVKGKSHPDLKIPSEKNEKGYEIVELKVRTSQLKYLKAELNERDEIFSTSDYLFFSYLLHVGSKESSKIIKERVCIYYLVVIKISKYTLIIPINELLDEIRMGTKDFTKELAEKSEIDEEKEELLGVDNMIKVVDLERKIKVSEADMGEKEKIIEEERKLRIENEKKLEKEKKQSKEKDKEIKRLKSQLKKK